ncbi:MAG TPA: hypothetical protein VG897_13530, partial [Terriglobales bacterium]|nr:hypothetical protein [Terriglobales bacterium]
VPELKGHNSFVKAALGGWELATILDYASGTPLTVFANSPQIEGAPGGLTGTAVGQGESRPNRVFGQSCRAPAGSPKFQWLNPAGWTIDNFQLGTFGNASVGECSGPGIANTDFSLYKNFKLTERVNLQFRMEFFNLFNKTQFRGNSADITGIDSNIADAGVACNATNVGDAGSVCYGHAVNTVGWSFGANSQDGVAYGHQTFGQASADKGPREIQYALKITF